MTTPPDASDFPTRMRRAVGRLSRRLRQTHAGAELTPSQYEVLVTLVLHSPVRHAELAALEGLNPTMLSRVVGKLEHVGWPRASPTTPTVESSTWQSRKKAATSSLASEQERSDVLRSALSGLSMRPSGPWSAALPALETWPRGSRTGPHERPGFGADGPSRPRRSQLPPLLHRAGRSRSSAPGCRRRRSRGWS